MLKLYKKAKDKFHYWEIWIDGDELVTHWGEVGTEGHNKDLAVKDGESAEEILEREAKAKIAEGYSEFTPRAVLTITYQGADLDVEENLDTRYDVEHSMKECLGWTGNGWCDGAEITSKSFTIKCTVVDSIVAAKSAIQTLKDANLLDGAQIETQDNPNEKKVVHWPTKHVKT